MRLKFVSSCPIQASCLPMSIIIVGVGPAEFDGKKHANAHRCTNVRMCTHTHTHRHSTEQMMTTVSCFFSAMIELDGDEVRISSKGRYAERDIVQVHHVPSVCSTARLQDTWSQIGRVLGALEYASQTKTNCLQPSSFTLRLLLLFKGLYKMLLIDCIA
jgi:hypothetical protein